MGKLTIHLQNGFESDDVVIASAGRELFRRAGVQTKRLLGLAEHATVDVPDGPLELDVAIPSRGIQRRIDLDASSDTHLGLSIEGDDLRVIKRDKPFGYG